MKIAFVLGTRPEIIKLAPVIKECQKRKFNFFIIHTNQHYSENLDKIFFKELKLPLPKYNLNIGSGSHAYQVGAALIEIEKILIKEKPDLVLVQGDTNSTLAGALAAVKIGMKIAHIEAGLRSGDRQMPEEINRILVDHISDFLFTPTKEAQKNLIFEGINKDKIFVVGNTIVDSVIQNLSITKKRYKILNKLGLKPKQFFLLTLHRQENVDNKERLHNIFEALGDIYNKYNLPIIFPIHPRTDNRIKNFKIDIPEGIMKIEPVGFLDFLLLENNAKLIFTDSGGVQEEACILKVPCVTLRDTTERPETLKIKSNILADHNKKKILKATEIMLKSPCKWVNPFGDGKASIKIIDIIKRIK
jgi:UDP-N-acetylglucosamine 2-epimerase (non-hydrolysing)